MHLFFGGGVFTALSTAAALSQPGTSQLPIASFYVVTTTADDGANSLRLALTSAQTDFTPSVISFDIPGAAPHTIAPLSPLPNVTSDVFIDGGAGPPVIELDGSSAGTDAVGLTVTGSDNTIRGLCINDFGGGGIWINGGDNNAVEGCRIGTDIEGNEIHRNGTLGGIAIQDGAANRVGGGAAGQVNLISGNERGVWILGDATTAGNTVRGNFIGVNPAGNDQRSNSLAGIEFSGLGGGNVIGGTVPGQGNLISGNLGSGIIIGDQGGENTVEGNYIGVAADGVTDLGNLGTGISIVGSPSNQIGGDAPGARNIISGNGGQGIQVSFSAAIGNRIQGNHIGLDATGSVAVRNSSGGVLISGAVGTEIGGADPGEGNVISGNFTNFGVKIEHTGAILNLVRGNLIGTDATGTQSRPNLFGVWIDSQTDATTVGGAASGSRNVISGNSGDGVIIAGGGNVQAVVRGNHIGVDITGLAPLGNGGRGIGCGAQASDLGSAAAGGGNVIAANAGDGIHITASNCDVANNLIGVLADGVTPAGNGGAGVFLEGGASDNEIGLSGAGNVIAHNNGAGVAMEFGDGNPVRFNSIHSNGGLGIDLANEGVTPNDAVPDSDIGGNHLQNFPTINSASIGGAGVLIDASLSSASNTTYTIDFYLSVSGDPSFHGEGQTWLTSTTRTTGGSGVASIAYLALASPVPPGRYVSLTATDPDGNTSEFSPWVLAAGRAATAEEIVNCILGLGAYTPDLDLDGSGWADAVDVVRAVPGFSTSQD